MSGERLAATLDADAWAKSEAMPSDEEITGIRRLIDRMKGDLDELPEDDRTQIEEAIAVVRRGRGKIVGLGRPESANVARPATGANRVTSSNTLIEGRQADSARRRRE